VGEKKEADLAGVNASFTARLVSFFYFFITFKPRVG